MNLDISNTSKKEKRELLSTHLKLHSGPIYQSLYTNKDLIIGLSPLNFHWYDVIAPLKDCNNLGWDHLASVVANLESRKIDFAFYIHSEDKDLVDSKADFLGLKHNGGDAYMVKHLIKKDLTESKIKNFIPNLEFKKVSIDNFESYKYLVDTIHGNENGLKVASEFAELMFNASNNNDLEQEVYIVLGYINNKAVSYAACIYSKKLDIAYLTNSGVHSEFRRKGIHTAMVEHRVDKAEDLGISRVYVITGQRGASRESVIKNGFREELRCEYYVPRINNIH
ncbi:MAG: GNAT family N-acetyltransferase [Candidatus Dojkabacteria bacterium]|nr:GNAT family N-acetyltransferase [Candidatus Dojkabacteria bacterium]MDQ7021471.1 GNAT family N-acetyltransferase [Candidatus Dojkabacteria bacterium]